MGLSNKLSCEAGSFSHCLNSHRFFQSEARGFISPWWNTWLHSLSHSPVLPSLCACICGPAWSSSCCIAVSPLCPTACVCPLQVWMNVCNLTPWLSDFHTVQFSVSSGWFFVFKFVVLPTPPSWPEAWTVVIFCLYICRGRLL